MNLWGYEDTGCEDLRIWGWIWGYKNISFDFYIFSVCLCSLLSIFCDNRDCESIYELKFTVMSQLGVEVYIWTVSVKMAMEMETEMSMIWMLMNLIEENCKCYQGHVPFLSCPVMSFSLLLFPSFLPPSFLPSFLCCLVNANGILQEPVQLVFSLERQ